MDILKNIPEPQHPKVINESIIYRCNKCGSSASKKGFLRLFGERTCDNEKCPNSEKRFHKL